MTVRELIRCLELCRQDAMLTTEGCDCDGDVGGVFANHGDVYLARSGSNPTEWGMGYQQIVPAKGT